VALQLLDSDTIILATYYYYIIIRQYSKLVTVQQLHKMPRNSQMVYDMLFV